MEISIVTIDVNYLDIKYPQIDSDKGILWSEKCWIYV